jgi:hypothetical protein
MTSDPAPSVPGTTQPTTERAYRHPVGRCQSVQCAACWNLTNLSLPIKRPGYCHHGVARFACQEGCRD